MKPTYRIKDWDEHFETAESRKLKSTRWVPMPTKHDGKSYRRITQHNSAVEIFCAWNLIVQVASKMPTRGVLSDTDGPLDADDLAAKTGFPSAIFATALPFLSSESIGWILLDQQRRMRQSARVRQSPPESAVVPADSSPEGKGTEGNGIEGNSLAAQARDVFSVWRATLNHPRSVLDTKRERLIIARLKDGYTVAQLQDAARGCKASAYHQGQNDSKTVYDRVDLIYRDAEHVDQFLSYLPSTNGKPLAKIETDEDRQRRESCLKCFGTGTEQTPRGARNCKHERAEDGTGIIHSSGESVERTSENRTESIS